MHGTFLNGGARRNPGASGGRLPFLWVSPTMRALDEMARRIADSDLTVLIRGESGVGKEVLARHVHDCSTRKHQPLVKVNCAAVPEPLLESELFGHEKAAFTGAESRRQGKFEAANGGSLMLDEITEMSLALQAKLLLVLQDKVFYRLGGNEPVTVDVRVLAATNRSLEQEVEEGRFREDLYFRLKVIDLYVPPLRERRAEIPLLVDLFLRHHAAQYARPVPELSDKLMSLLASHRWSGNVRELENAIKRLVVLGDETSVITELLANPGERDPVQAVSPRRGQPVPPHGRQAPPGGQPAPPEAEEGLSLKEVGRRAALAAERGLILVTLEKTRWNRVKTARLLSVSYKTLLTKMKLCGLG